MSCIWLDCCGGKVVDTDYDVEQVYFFNEKHTPVRCVEHAIEHLEEEYGITDERIIDEICYNGRVDEGEIEKLKEKYNDSNNKHQEKL